MSNITKNIDSIISQAINKPKVDGIPLYARIDGEQEQGFIKSTSKSDKWEKASKTTYSSPTNVRKLIISGDKIVIQTYKPVIIYGKPSSDGCWTEVKLDGDNNLIKLVGQMLSYDSSLSKYYMEKQINSKCKEPDRVIIKGTGLGALTTPWVISNIEEIYFDISLLASETYRNMAIGCNELFNEYLKGKRGLVDSNIALRMFMEATGVTTENVRNKFPRLRIVSLISELSNVLKNNYDKGKTNIDSIEESIKLWVESEVNINLIKQSNSLMVINKIDKDIPKYNTKFSLRDGIYRYDNEVLVDYVEGYKKRVQERTKEVKKEIVRTAKSDLEILLDDVEEKRGRNDLKALLLIALDGMPKEEVEQAFKEMSEEGEKKYRKYL